MTNPLQKYFRQPAIYLKLPSGGHFWPAGSIDLGPNGEMAVYPMTARDELTYKIPDALMNGQSTVDVIQSCVPQIKDAWQCPAVDLDAILIAIRIASYGNTMEFLAVCPKCNERNEYTKELSPLLDNLGAPNFGQPVSVDGLEIYLQPQSYRNMSQANIKVYQEQRILNTVNNSELSDEEKIKKFAELFREMTNMTVLAMANNIRAVKTDQDIVTDTGFILEFLSNCSKSTWQAIEKRLQEMSQQLALPNNHVTCDSCKYEFDTPLVFDQSNFFA